MNVWHPDLLAGYESCDLALPEAAIATGEPTDTELVGTLVRQVGQGPSRRAVLYIHGWNDYFFQTHLADFFVELGFDFYAVDLRRYGRSHRNGQLRGFITDLNDYDAELDAAAQIIEADHDQLLLMGHSTGGLIAALWAAKRPERVAALLLNSPWLDLQGSAMVRTLGLPVIDALGSSLPTSVIRLPDPGIYNRALHISADGEWDYDLDLKTSPSPPVRVGWLRAILRGHAQIAAGLQLEMPVLVMCSTKTDFRRRWHQELKSVDTVLDVEQIASRASRLGCHLTILRFDKGMHDLVLSAAPVRERVFDEMQRWLGAYVPHPSSAGPRP